MVRVNQLSHTGLASDEPKSYISNLSEISEDGEEKTYWMLDTDGRYSYIYNSDPESIRKIGKRIKAPTRKKKLHQRMFNAGKRTSLLYKLMPSTSKISVNVPESFEFDFGVIGHKASFVKRNDSVLLMGPKEALYRDVRASFMIPDSVNAPEILTSRVQDGYYIQEYVFGSEPSSDNFDAVLSAYDELRPMYEKNRRNTDLTKEVVKELASRASEKMDANEEDIASAVNSYSLPKKVHRSFIHGDLFFSNIMLRDWDDEVSIIDWSWSRNDFVFADLYLPYQMYCIDTGERDVFDQMVSEEGRFHSLHEKSVEKLGNQVYDGTEVYSGMPVLYLLYAVATYSDEYMTDLSKELLEDHI